MRKGVISHDGKNIRFNDLSKATQATFNFAETFTFVVCNFSAGMLRRTYDKGTCDLAVRFLFSCLLPEGQKSSTMTGMI